MADNMVFLPNHERDEPLDAAGLKKLRAIVIQTAERARVPAPAEFTCDTCEFRFRCKLVFDLYNTAGDCLAEK